jgi:hypothetical protein
MSQSEIEKQLSLLGYEGETVSVTNSHLRSLRTGRGKDTLIAVTKDHQGRFSLTPEARKRLAAGPFSDVLMRKLSPRDIDVEPPRRTDSTAARADSVLVGDYECDIDSDSNGLEAQTGAGFGDAAENKLVESKAVQAVTKDSSAISASLTSFARRKDWSKMSRSKVSKVK